MKYIIALIILTFSFNASASGRFFSGNDLKEQADDEHLDLAFGGYILGVADAELGNLLCIPNYVTAQQLRDVVYKYLDEHPQDRHKNGATLVTTALADAFPCK